MENNSTENLNFIAECEKNVLSILMHSTDQASLIFQNLKSEYWVDNRHRILFNALKGMIEHNEELNFYSIVNSLLDQKDLDHVKESYLEEIFQCYVHDIFLIPNLQALINHAKKQMFLQIAQNIQKTLQEKHDFNDLLELVAKQLDEIFKSSLEIDFPLFSEALLSFENRLKILSESKNDITGVPSGIAEFDVKTHGFQKGDLIIIAGRPSMGKTSFALNILRNAAWKNYGVAFISLEMPTESLIQKLFAMNTHIDNNKLKTGKDMSPDDWKDLYVTRKNLESRPIYIDDTPGLSIQTISNKLWHLFNKFSNPDHKPKLVIIDYLQLINLDNANYNNRQQEVSKISLLLKQLARKLEVPIICLSQLSRAVEKRGMASTNENAHKSFRHIPVLSDLRDSGAIEQDADLICFLYRLDYYKQAEEKFDPRFQQELFLRISKHRNGEVGELSLNFNLKTGQIFSKKR